MRDGPPKAFDHEVPPAPPAVPFDPLRLCIFTTITVIAWIITPPAAAMVFSAIGIVGYAKARRRGLMRSRCLLGDTRLVLVYLGVVFVVSAAVTGYTLLDRLGVIG